MRSTTFAALAALAFPLLVSGQHQVHRRLHQRRDEVVETQVVTAVATQAYDFEDVVVWVDENNVPISSSTSYRDVPGPTSVRISTPAATPASPKPQVKQLYVQPDPPSDDTASPAPPPETSAPPTPPPADTPPQQPAPQSSAAHSESDGDNHQDDNQNQSSGAVNPATGGPGFSSGVTYTPYNADHSCKSADQVASDLKNAVGKYQVIRTYGTDCDQLAKIIKATGGKISIFAGIFDINNVQGEVDKIVAAVNGNWKLINSVSVGNEVINGGRGTVDQVTSAIKAARVALQSKGYGGPVVTVDTMIAMKNNPQLCQASDFCAINCHAFFDGGVTASGAGKFVADWVRQISQAAGGKTTVVTESGWPTRGDTNNMAVPSQANHQTALASLRDALPTNLMQYGMYNDLWKSDGPGTFNAEKFWGIYGSSSS